MSRKILTTTATVAMMTAATAVAALLQEDESTPAPHVATGLPSPAVMSYDRLHGLPVYDANSDPVGTVAQVRVNADGAVTGAIVEIGGFLGFGARQVDLDLRQMAMRGLDSDAADPAVQLLVGNDTLDRLPRFDG